MDETTIGVLDDKAVETAVEGLRQALEALRTAGPVTAETMAERLRQGQAALDEGREVYYGLHAQRQAGTLPRAGYVDYLLLEDLCGLVGQALVTAQNQFVVVQLREKVETARQQHDDGIPEA